MKSKLGSGKRFASLSSELEEKGAANPRGLAAWIGRRKLGKGRFQRLAEKGAARARKEHGS